jgi:cell division protein FtsW
LVFLARMPDMTSTRTLPLAENGTGQGLALATLGLLAVGAVTVFSALASVSTPGPWYLRQDCRHLMFAGLAAIVLFTAWRINYHIFARGRFVPILPTLLLVASLGCSLLVFVPGVGMTVGHDSRWIKIGPFITFQPSELIKISLMIFLASWLTRPGINVKSFWKVFLPAMIVIGASTMFVITQDFGTAVVIGISAVLVLLLAGVPVYYLALLVPLAYGVWEFFVVRVPHRWDRISGFLDPWSLTNPSSYQPSQSLLAIMTGGWTGKGLGRGLSGFLPEHTTDFIFASLCQQWGLAGAGLLMTIILIWIWQARKAALRASDNLGRVLAGAMGAMIAVQAAMHIAVDLVAIPATGLCLPFVSAGGTALVMMAGAAAVIISVTAHRNCGLPAATDASSSPVNPKLVATSKS